MASLQPGYNLEGYVASEKALRTAELLERICINVDSKTLLLAQSVCRDFQSFTATTPRLQKKLCFRPVES
jgi:hypothetical protein